MVRVGKAGASFALLANVLLTGLGAVLLLQAWRMNPAWAERHFLPVWAWNWDAQLHIVAGLRVLAAAAGLAVLLLLRPWLARACAQGRGRAAMGSVLGIVLAVLAALLVTELVLRTQTWRSVQERWDREPLRLRDAEFGWTFAPNHAGAVKLDGRVVQYATGPFGYRAPRPGIAPDLSRPTIVFAGESVVFGYGLDWAETIPAQVEAMTLVQTVNIAVNAHATDQVFLRLRRELPRFSRPLAVVIPFMPRLLDRNLDQDKPYLDKTLRWHPARPPPLRIVELARRMLRYRGTAEIAAGEEQTAKILAAATRLVEGRGAKAIVLVPQYLPEERTEVQIRQRVLDRQRIPYLLVPVPAAARSATNFHPNAMGAKLIARRIADELAAMGLNPSTQARR